MGFNFREYDQDLTQEENDQGQLEPILTACVQQAGQAPEQLLADAGYNSEANACLKEQELFAQTELYICQQKENKERQEAARLNEQESEQALAHNEEHMVEDAPNAPGETDAAQRVRERMQKPEGKTLYKRRIAASRKVFCFLNHGHYLSVLLTCLILRLK